ncbi:MAG: metallopeptidase family protein [Chloroflexi bacterium]|nr:metallopeptidase family protein [Chloroflexota bacterium]
MSKLEFEKFVKIAIRKLPPRFRKAMASGNLVIVVQQRPTREQLFKLKLDPVEESLFGLYEGVSLPNRTQGYNMTVPDKITIFQEPLEAAYPNPLSLKEQVRRTVFHEVAHFFGISDEELDAMGWG